MRFLLFRRSFIAACLFGIDGAENIENENERQDTDSETDFCVISRLVTLRVFGSVDRCSLPDYSSLGRSIFTYFTTHVSIVQMDRTGAS